MTNEHIIEKGKDAKLLMDNPLLIEAFKSIESDLFNSFVSTKYKNADDMLELNRSVNNLHKVKQALQDFIDNGEATKARLKQLKRNG